MEKLKIEEETTTKSKGSICEFLLNLSLVVAIVVIFIAGWTLYAILKEYKTGSDEYSKIKDMVVVEREADGEKIQELPEQEDVKYFKAPITVDFNKLQAINPDVIGWLYVEALPEISYPVVKGEDNEYYLHRTYEKKDNFAGTIFIDCENSRDFSDCNTIIYGHNMKNGTMFGQLKQFKLPETYERSNIIWILTPEGDYKYEIISEYVAAVGSETYTLVKGPGKDLISYANKMQANSQQKFADKVFSEKDKLITLSTCTGNEKTRFVVHAVKVDP